MTIAFSKASSKDLEVSLMKITPLGMKSLISAILSFTCPLFSSLRITLASMILSKKCSSLNNLASIALSNFTSAVK